MTPDPDRERKITPLVLGRHVYALFWPNVSFNYKNNNILSATTEVLALYMDLNKRKVSEFESKKIKIIDDFIIKNKSRFNADDLKFTPKLKK